MHEGVKTIRLWQMIYLGKGAPILRQVIHAIISIAALMIWIHVVASMPPKTM